MSTMEILDEPVKVTAMLDEQGQLRPQSLTWRDKKYTLITLGRQWDEADYRSVLVEAADGTRFELRLGRDTLTWRVSKVWWAQTIA